MTSAPAYEIKLSEGQIFSVDLDNRRITAIGGLGKQYEASFIIQHIRKYGHFKVVKSRYQPSTGDIYHNLNDMFMCEISKKNGIKRTPAAN